MKVTLVINEIHNLLEHQEKVLKQTFGEEIEIERYNIPDKGLSVEEMKKVVEELSNRNHENIVFVSPIALMVGWLAQKKGKTFYVFHNAKREKTETADGRLITRIVPDGWELVKF